MNLFANFSITRVPRIEFGSSVFIKTAELASHFGRRALLVTGGRSLRATPHWDALHTALKKNNMSWVDTQIHGEPSPGQVDALVNAGGLAADGLLAHLGPADWDQCQAVNLRGVFLCARAVLPLMVKKNNGHILQIGSFAARGAVGLSAPATFCAEVSPTERPSC